MARRSTGALALLTIVSVVSAAPAGAAEDCRAWQENGVHIEPIRVSSVERGRVAPIAEGTVVGEEAMQIATRGWMLGAELRIPGPDGLSFPAGTPIEPAYAARHHHCLPHAPPPRAVTEGSRLRGRGRLACLEDRDGDGRHERVNLYATDYAMHVPQTRFYRSITLPVPVRFAEDPLGDARSRRHVMRRIELSPVREGAVRLIVQHAFRDLEWQGDRGRFDEDGDGGLVYRLPPPIPVPIDRRDNNWRMNDGEDRTVPLADGDVVVGGLRLTILRRTAGWTIMPAADAYPRWIHFGCGGRSLRLGVQPSE